MPVCGQTFLGICNFGNTLGINVGERFFVYFNPNATGVGEAGVEIFSKKNYRGGGGGAFIRDLRVQA